VSEAKRCKIIKLEIQNIKGVRAIEIEPDGIGLVMIGGENAQGKTSILDAIEMAMAGGQLPAKPIRDGEDTGRIVLRTEDLVVTKILKDGKKPVLKVEGVKGRKYASPQTLLDELVGELSFDPLDFADQKGAKQLETLRRLVKVDTAELDAERLKRFDERTIVNRDLVRLRAQIDGMDEADGEEESIVELMKELDKANEINEANRKEGEKVDRMIDEYERLGQRIAASKGSLKSARDSLGQIQTEIKSREGEIELLQKDYKRMMAEVLVSEGARASTVDTETAGIRERIDNAEEHNKAISESKHRDELVTQAERLEEESQAFSNRIDAIDTAKEEMVASAKFPVEGLSFDSDGVLYNGNPFEGASRAEKLRVSVAMGIAMNPNLAVMMVRDGSALDKKSMKMVADMAIAADFQIWVEDVIEGEEAQVIIEAGNPSEVIVHDGMIKGKKGE